MDRVILICCKILCWNYCWTWSRDHCDFPLLLLCHPPKIRHFTLNFKRCKTRFLNTVAPLQGIFLSGWTPVCAGLSLSKPVLWLDWPLWSYDWLQGALSYNHQEPLRKKGVVLTSPGHCIAYLGPHSEVVGLGSRGRERQGETETERERSPRYGLGLLLLGSKMGPRVSRAHSELVNLKTCE